MPKRSRAAIPTIRRVARGFLAIFVFLATYTMTTPVVAQSFLGTIRGTVVDPQGSVVPGAAVLIVDEATNVPRAVETDAEGRYEATNLRPGTYRVEVVTTNFKKFERTGVVLRAAATALVDVNLSVGGINETVTVSADAINNITLSRPFARPDEQQLHDLPRNSRDIQSFLPQPQRGRRSDDIQFLGPKRMASRTSGRTGIDERHLRTIGNSAPGRRDPEMTVLNSHRPMVAWRGWWSRPSAARALTAGPASTISTATA